MNIATMMRGFVTTHSYIWTNICFARAASRRQNTIERNVHHSICFCELISAIQWWLLLLRTMWSLRISARAPCICHFINHGFFSLNYLTTNMIGTGSTCKKYLNFVVFAYIHDFFVLLDLTTIFFYGAHSSNLALYKKSSVEPLLLVQNSLRACRT